MAKKKVAKPERKPTKRQLSHWQQQRRRQRIILGSGIAIILAALGLVGTGVYYQWYLPEYKPLHQTVVEVNNTRFNMDYFIKALEYYSGGQSQYIQYLVEPVAEAIQRNELIRQAALKLGISVSNKEVDQELKSRGLPINRAVRDIVRTQMLVAELREKHFGPMVPLSAEQRQIVAMFLESQSQAVEVSSRIEAGEDFGQIAGELSLDSLTKEKKGGLGWRPKGVLDSLLSTSVFADYAFGSEVGVIAQPLYDKDKTKNLGYWLIRVLERKQDTKEAHVQAILLASKEEALNVKARLEAGEDFATLAGELSQWSGGDKDKGDLGWLAPGTMSQEFDGFVFSSETELNIISEPIADDGATTKGGYWLVRVLAKEANKEISAEDRDALVSEALSDWVASLWDNPKNEVMSYLDDEMKAFAVARALGGG